MYIQRKIKNQFSELIGFFPAVAVIGPRQVGKTTFVRNYFKGSDEILFLDLETPSDLDKLHEPELFLKRNQHKTIVIDEIQRNPELFPLMRSLIDQHRRPCRFIILGSASPELLRQSSESLAGRIAYLKLNPIALGEISGMPITHDQLWFRGGFPDSLLAPNEKLSNIWKQNFIRTYVERDLPILGINASPVLIERLWTMLANMNGQLLNYTNLSKALGISIPTLKNYLDFLENSFLIQRLYPFSQNLKKRLVKSPKIYIPDTGILHSLLRLNSLNDLFGHPVAGSSWENFCLQQILRTTEDNFDPYFYRTHAGSECDLVIVKGLKPVFAVEFKLSSSPSKNKGNTIAFQDLGTTENYIISPDADDYLVSEHTRVCSLKTFLEKYLLKHQNL